MDEMSKPTSKTHILLRVLTAVAFVFGMVVPFLPLGTAQAANGTTVTSATFSSQGGTTFNNVTYAKPGATMTLTVNTNATTQCVELSDGTNVVDYGLSTSQSTWTFDANTKWTNVVAGSGTAIATRFTAPSSGTVSLTATAYRNTNGNGKCT